MLENISEIMFSPIATAFYFACGFYWGMIRLSKHLSSDSKETLTLWLWGEYDSAWSYHFCNLFDMLFGDEHVSWKCFIRSSIASLLAALLLFWLFSEDISNRALGDLDFWRVVLFGAAINIIPDYLSLYETRWLLQQLKYVRSFIGYLVVLFLDIVFTGFIIWQSIALFQYFRGEQVLSVIEMMAVFSIFSVFFYSTFLTSVWSWIYCLSIWIVRIFTHSRLNRILNVEKEPLEQIALVGAILIFICVTIFGFFPHTGNQQTTAFDNWLCSISPASICPHIARLTNDEKKVLYYSAKSCEGSETIQCTDVLIPFFKTDIVEHYLYFFNECKNENVSVCNSLGWLYMQGRGVKQDYTTAVALYELACNKGNVEGCFNLGFMYDKGHGVKQDHTKAESLYEMACNKNNQLGCFNLGWLYAEDHGGKKDYTKAVSLFRQICDKGMKGGCSSLGFMYDKGRGVKQDRTKAASLYEIGCKDGIESACVNFGIMYSRGRGVKKDYTKAKSLFEMTCNKKIKIGCYNLGLMYFSGFGMRQSYSKAASLFNVACKNGVPASCSILGVMYNEGHGVKQSDSKALSLYQMACENGDLNGCMNLNTLKREVEE